MAANRNSTLAQHLVVRLKKNGEPAKKPGLKPGQGGRPKGYPNKAPRQRTQEVLEQMRHLGADPFAFLAYTMMNMRKELGLKHGRKDPDIPFEYRIKAARELAQYMAPKRRAIDISEGGKSLGETFAEVVATFSK